LFLSFLLSLSQLIFFLIFNGYTRNTTKNTRFVDVRPAPNARIDHLGHALATAHLEAAVQRALKWDFI
jgi:hypothetical protein